MYVHGIRALFRFEGYVVRKIAMSSEIVQVTLPRDGRRTLRCPACGVQSPRWGSELEVGRPVVFAGVRASMVPADSRCG